MSLPSLLDAIFKDDLPAARRLLREDHSLALCLAQKPKLYRVKISHWIYVGDTPLHLAAAGHRTEITKLLLDAGADANACNNHRKSGPLHYASDSHPELGRTEEIKQVETLQLLLNADANINSHDRNGATPLHRAVRTRGATAVEFLLGNGADDSLRNNSGSTAFHLAVQNTGRGGSGTDEAIAAQRKIIEIFLARGANPLKKDNNGKTVLACAKSLWIQEMLKA